MPNNSFYLEDIPFDTFLKYMFRDSEKAYNRYQPINIPVKYKNYYKNLYISYTLDENDNRADIKYYVISSILPIKDNYLDYLVQSLSIPSSHIFEHVSTIKTTTSEDTQLYLFPKSFYYPLIDGGLSTEKYCAYCYGKFYPYCDFISNNLIDKCESSSAGTSLNSQIVSTTDSTRYYDNTGKYYYYNIVVNNNIVGKIYENYPVYSQDSVLDGDEQKFLFLDLYDTSKKVWYSNKTFPNSPLERFKFYRDYYLFPKKDPVVDYDTTTISDDYYIPNSYIYAVKDKNGNEKLVYSFKRSLISSYENFSDTFELSLQSEYFVNYNVEEVKELNENTNVLITSNNCTIYPQYNINKVDNTIYQTIYTPTENTLNFTNKDKLIMKLLDAGMNNSEISKITNNLYAANPKEFSYTFKSTIINNIKKLFNRSFVKVYINKDENTIYKILTSEAYSNGIKKYTYTFSPIGKYINDFISGLYTIDNENNYEKNNESTSISYILEKVNGNQIDNLYTGEYYLFSAVNANTYYIDRNFINNKEKTDIGSISANSTFDDIIDKFIDKEYFRDMFINSEKLLESGIYSDIIKKSIVTLSELSIRNDKDGIITNVPLSEDYFHDLNFILRGFINKSIQFYNGTEIENTGTLYYNFVKVLTSGFIPSNCVDLSSIITSSMLDETKTYGVDIPLTEDEISDIKNFVLNKPVFERIADYKKYNLNAKKINELIYLKKLNANSNNKYTRLPVNITKNSSGKVNIKKIDDYESVTETIRNFIIGITCQNPNETSVETTKWYLDSYKNDIKTIIDNISSTHITLKDNIPDSQLKFCFIPESDSLNRKLFIDYMNTLIKGY